MLTKRISIAAALVLLGVAAACSGNSNPTPVYPGAGQNVTGQPFTFTPVGGYSGTVSIAGPSGASPAPLTVSLSTTAPASTGPVSLAKRAPQAVASPVPQVYITITAGTGGATLYSLSSLQLQLPAPVPSGQSLYLAYYNGTQWVPVFTAATLVSGTTYSFAGGILNPSITLAAGASAYFAAYESSIPIGPTPTPSPSPSPTSSAVNVIQNGTFETGSLTPWTACSYKHTPYDEAVNPSPAPAATSSQPPDSSASPSPVITGSELTPFVALSPPPANFNPDHTGDSHPDFGSYSAVTGSLNAMINGTTGICQTVTVPDSGTLSFWVYEGGTAYGFYNGDQEAQILDSTGTTVLKTLFVELNCYYDSTNFPQSPLYATSGCFPMAYGGTSPYTDWQGGFWTERGPYDLSSYAGQTVTLFLGTWSDQSHTGPTSYANYMFVDNVQLVSGAPSPMATISATIQGGSRR